MAYDEAFFMSFGLNLLGFTDQMIARTGRATNMSRFRDGFYTDPSIVAILFNDLKEIDDKINPKYLMLALHYLRKYPTKHALAVFLGSTEKTALKWVHIYVNKIQGLKANKVVWVFDQVDVFLQDRHTIFSDDNLQNVWIQKRFYPTDAKV